MFEKKGLPAKQSMRGAKWVVEASHCQGCASQLTFIKRKHHCRRSGGIFCGNCTAQRMVLRGHGDSPVRICDPCKKLEEAARYELRHGRGSKPASKGKLKAGPSEEDELLAQIVGAHKKPSEVPARLQGTSSSSSSSKDPSLNEENEIIRSFSAITPQKESRKFPDKHLTAIQSDFDGETGTNKKMSETTNKQDPEVSAFQLLSDHDSLKNEIISHKRKALALKREGKVSEAKEELRQAKLLEKNLEESNQTTNLTVTTKSEESDREPERGKLLENELEDADSRSKLPVNTNPLTDNTYPLDMGDEIGDSGVTESDMQDPNVLSVLHNLRWDEKEDSGTAASNIPVKHPPRKNKLVILRELLAVKRRALALRREGKFEESQRVLEGAQLLERELDDLDTAASEMKDIRTSQPNTAVNLNPSGGRSSSRIDSSDMAIMNWAFQFRFDYLKSMNLLPGKSIDSPTFTAGGYNWSLKFYPQGVGSEYEGSHVAMFLCLESTVDKEITVKFTFQLLNKKGKFIPVRFPEVVTYTKTIDISGEEKFIGRNALETLYCVDGFLVIFCSISIIDGNSSPLTEPIIVHTDHGGLCEHIEKLWDKREICDVTFEVEGESISAHRVMLAARSPVFEAELFGSVTEAKREHVKIDEMKADVFKALLHFVYTDQLVKDASNDHDTLRVELLQGLFVAADRYGLDKLTLLCEEQLAMNLSVDTVVTTLFLADRHNCPALKKKCLDYASCPEKFLLVALTDGYLNIMLEAPYLLAELSKMIKSASCFAKQK